MNILSSTNDVIIPKLQLVAWEITRNCNLCCAHCRASSGNDYYQDELLTEDYYDIIDQILEIGKPIIILTGGEPLIRKDVFSIAKYAVNKGLKVVLGTNGTLITKEIASRLKSIPISRVGISLDFPVENLQDKFRGKTGAFAATMAGITNARKAGIEVQINCTVTKLNVDYLDELLRISLKKGAVAFHPFMLVPTGRGKGLESVELPPEQFEATLNWIYDKQVELGNRMFFKPTDVPHYVRVVNQRKKQEAMGSSNQPQNNGSPENSISRGCLAGTGFCFISYQGKVQGCGYLNVEAGDLRKQSFDQIWINSPLFNNLRDLSNIKGKCGSCEYKKICGGCRARAYEATGDYLESEPYCIYEPIKSIKL